jgi:hypothetical protein
MLSTNCGEVKRAPRRSRAGSPAGCDRHPARVTARVRRWVSHAAAVADGDGHNPLLRVLGQTPGQIPLRIDAPRVANGRVIVEAWGLRLEA